MSAKISTRTPLTDIDDLDDFEIRDNSETPNNDAQNKKVSYGIVKGILAAKQPVRAATTVNGALATAYENGDTIDGVSLSTGDRILIKNQSTGAENGVYIVNSSGAPTRAIDFDTTSKVKGGMFIMVQEGTVNADSLWRLTNNGTITIDTTALVFARFGDSVLGVHDIWIGAAGAWDIITAGCQQLTKQEHPTNDINNQTLNFDDTVEEHAQFTIAMIRNWDGGTITATFYWDNAGGASTETVDWALSGRAYADGDNEDQAFGSEVVTTDTWQAQNREHISPESSAITLAGSPAGGQRCQFQVARKVATDNLTGDAKLLGIMLHITINQAVAA